MSIDDKKIALVRGANKEIGFQISRPPAPKGLTVSMGTQG